uniref:Uncharacterized protein n=1 Tax=Spironucleus salmonicida TaxID=348837 RepID=V6LEC5_9EUKA|eukprot:EST42860.1 Hypothetical protein SS50377_17483 [Spironucleus salmonicida]
MIETPFLQIVQTELDTQLSEQEVHFSPSHLNPDLHTAHLHVHSVQLIQQIELDLQSPVLVHFFSHLLSSIENQFLHTIHISLLSDQGLHFSSIQETQILFSIKNPYQKVVQAEKELAFCLVAGRKIFYRRRESAKTGFAGAGVITIQYNFGIAGLESYRFSGRESSNDVILKDLSQFKYLAFWRQFRAVSCFRRNSGTIIFLHF